MLKTDHSAKVFSKSIIDYFTSLIFSKTSIDPLAIFPIKPATDFVYPKTTPYYNKQIRWDPSKLIDSADQWYGERTIWDLQIGNVIPRPTKYIKETS